MSRENVDIARRGFEAFSQGGMDAVLDTLHQEIEVHDHFAPDLGVYRGRDGMVEYMAQVAEVWEGFRAEPEEFIESGDQVLVVVRISGRGRDSGVPAEVRVCHVWTYRDGKAVRLDTYPDKVQALEAVPPRK